MVNKFGFSGRVLVSITMIFLFSIQLHGQSESGDFFSNIGKIYVVVAVVLISFLGILAYLLFLDKKVREIEKKIEE